MTFSRTSKTNYEHVCTERGDTDFFNLKNKAEGARRYGWKFDIVKFSNPDGSFAFRAEYQTTLNGHRYQSSKYGKFVASVDEARAAGLKTVAGATKRYAKLALDPSNKIEHRA